MSAEKITFSPDQRNILEPYFDKEMGEMFEKILAASNNKDLNAFDRKSQISTCFFWIRSLATSQRETVKDMLGKYYGIPENKLVAENLLKIYDLAHGKIYEEKYIQDKLINNERYNGNLRDKTPEQVTEALCNAAKGYIDGWVVTHKRAQHLDSGHTTSKPRERVDLEKLRKSSQSYQQALDSLAKGDNAQDPQPNPPPDNGFAASVESEVNAFQPNGYMQQHVRRHVRPSDNVRGRK